MFWSTQSDFSYSLFHQSFLLPKAYILSKIKKHDIIFVKSSYLCVPVDLGNILAKLK